MKSSTKNHIVLTGTIAGLRGFCKYIPEPLTEFDLHVYRNQKNNTAEAKYDLIRIILFNDEEFHKKFSNNNRIKIIGELQSRNYNNDNYEVAPKIKRAVQNYIELFEEFPCKVKPIGNRKEVIQWDKLVKTALLADIPLDSLYVENGTKSRDKKDKFVYKIDKDQVIYKETEHVKYEVLVHSYERIDEELDVTKGDINRAELIGQITSKRSTEVRPNLYNTSFNISTQSSFFPGRHFFNNAYFWEDKTFFKSRHVQVKDYVRIVGRLQSRDYDKDIKLRKKTYSQNQKQLVITKTFTTREISISKLEKV